VSGPGLAVAEPGFGAGGAPDDGREDACAAGANDFQVGAAKIRMGTGAWLTKYAADGTSHSVAATAERGLPGSGNR
jgi:hypothetical protein